MNFISIPVTGSNNFIVNINTISTCLRISTTKTVLVIEGGVGATSTTDNIEITHAADTALASVAYSIMQAIVRVSGGPVGKVETVIPAQAISAIALPGGGGGVVTSVTASLPLSSSGGTTPNITIAQANTTTNGYLSSTDWNTFNNKGNGDMLASIYDPTGQADDVYDYANALGITQVTGSIITAPTLTGNVNDWNPTGFATANMIRVDLDSNNRQITGMIAPSAGVNRIVRINNLNTGSNDIKYMENDSGSVAANRFLLRDNADKSSKPNETAAFWYDHTSSRWRPLNRVG